MIVKPKNQRINLQYTTIIDPLPHFIYEGLKEHSRNANLYHSQASEFIEKIAEELKLSPKMIFLAAGADEAAVTAFRYKDYFAKIIEDINQRREEFMAFF